MSELAPININARIKEQILMQFDVTELALPRTTQSDNRKLKEVSGARSTNQIGVLRSFLQVSAYLVLQSAGYAITTASNRPSARNPENPEKGELNRRMTQGACMRLIACARALYEKSDLNKPLEELGSWLRQRSRINDSELKLLPSRFIEIYLGVKKDTSVLPTNNGIHHPTVNFIDVYRNIQMLRAEMLNRIVKLLVPFFEKENLDLRPIRNLPISDTLKDALKAYLLITQNLFPQNYSKEDFADLTPTRAKTGLQLGNDNISALRERLILFQQGNLHSESFYIDPALSMAIAVDRNSQIQVSTKEVTNMRALVRQLKLTQV